MTEPKRMKSDQVRREFADVLQFVRTGGTVVVEHYNKPVARIVPEPQDDLRWNTRCRDCGSLLSANPRYSTDPDHVECMDCGSTNLDRVPVPDDDGLALITQVEEAADNANLMTLHRALLTEVYADQQLAARVLRNLTVKLDDKEDEGLRYEAQKRGHNYWCVYDRQTGNDVVATFTGTIAGSMAQQRANELNADHQDVQP
jgi:antitoxin (DNA-binding transcriptional repressor) of toxin-antitoxin stability system